jgi:histidinol-phosphate aminotransferase
VLSPVLEFCNKQKLLVLVSHGYEAPAYAAKIVNAPVFRVPLADPKDAARNDIKAMLATTPNPGILYLCNPNNPTGTLTPEDDIVYAAEHMPKGSILLVDEV